MKRSKMIENIRQFLWTNYPEMHQSNNGVHLNSEAEELLSFLEQKGLRPPAWVKPGKVYYNSDSEHTWEPESQ